MTFLLLLGLVYVVLGGATAMKIRTLGIPNFLHICSVYDGCPEETKHTPQCPMSRAGREPIPLAVWIGVVGGWPAVWVYEAVYVTAYALSSLLSHRF